MSIKEDCFAFTGSRHDCRALTELICKNKDCKFYKTKQEYLAGVKILEELEAKRERGN